MHGAVHEVDDQLVEALKNKKLAKETFQSILNLKTSPSSLSTRARNMVEYLKEE